MQADNAKKRNIASVTNVMVMMTFVMVMTNVIPNVIEQKMGTVGGGVCTNGTHKTVFVSGVHA